MLQRDDNIRSEADRDASARAQTGVTPGPVHALTHEQRLLDENARRFIREHGRFSGRNVSAPDRAEADREIWQHFADMGWLGLICPEDDGGFGGSAIELGILMENLGRGLISGPFLPTAILGGGILAAAGCPEQKRTVLAPLIAGEVQLAVGFLEPRGGYDPAHVETTAVCDDGAYILNGHKAVVLNAPEADHLIVSARTTGAPSDPFGISLFLIPRGTPGLVLQPYPTIDGGIAAELILQGARVPADARIGKLWEGLQILETVLDEATLACASEALGTLEAAIEMTIDYLRTRKQFGKTLSSFQALRHRVVDLHVAQEELRSLIFWAARERDPTLRKKAISAAKIFIGDCGTKAMLDTIQLHGAIGMTDAFPVGHYVKRFTAIDRMFGGAAEHLQRFQES